MAVRDEKYFKDGRLITARVPLEIASKYDQLRGMFGNNRRFAIEGKPSKTHQMVVAAIIQFVWRLMEFQGERKEQWLEYEFGPIYDQLDILASRFLAEQSKKEAAGEEAAQGKAGIAEKSGPKKVKLPGAEGDSGLTIEDDRHDDKAGKPKGRRPRRSNG